MAYLDWPKGRIKWVHGGMGFQEEKLELFSGKEVVIIEDPYVNPEVIDKYRRLGCDSKKFYVAMLPSEETIGICEHEIERD